MKLYRTSAIAFHLTSSSTHLTLTTVHAELQECQRVAGRARYRRLARNDPALGDGVRTDDCPPPASDNVERPQEIRDRVTISLVACAMSGKRDAIRLKAAALDGGNLLNGAQVAAVSNRSC